MAGGPTMCIGVPCCIKTIDPIYHNQAQAEVNGIICNIDISLITQEYDESLIGQWVLVHTGFAMSKLDEEEAQNTLLMLNEMQEEEADVAVLFQSQDRF